MMVIKAISWALRSIIQHDRDKVEQFLEKHSSKLHNSIVREVKTKLKTGLKNPNFNKS